MKITAIRQQERLKGRYTIYVDEKYAFSLSVDALLDQRLHTGQEIDEAGLKLYEKLSADDKAYRLSLAYVARRMRSQWELAEYLRRKGYESELGQQILQKLEGLGLVDDAKFAEAWVRNRRMLKPISKRRITQELRQKHLTGDVIGQALAADTADDQTVLHKLIAHKRRQATYQDDLKLMQYLARQGFDYDDIKSALQAEV